MYATVKSGLERSSSKLANNSDSNLDNDGLDMGSDSEGDSRTNKEALQIELFKVCGES